MLRITSLLQLYIIVLNQTFTEQACDRILAVFFSLKWPTMEWTELFKRGTYCILAVLW
jgi:hypothetical protein